VDGIIPCEWVIRDCESVLSQEDDSGKISEDGVDLDKRYTEERDV
jgi:hypothetical protein